MAELDKTRAIVTEGEAYDGDVIPTEKAEISRPVRIKRGASVSGGVYGETVELFPEADVAGSVMASDAVEFDGGRVRGEVGTPGKVTGERAVVHGSVTGTRVTLSNCVVRGNVVGTNVILDDCLVVGLVSAEKELRLSNTLCYTFKSYGESYLDEASVVLPQAIADGGTRFRSPVEVTGLGQLELEEGDRPLLTEEDAVEQDGTTYLSLAPRLLDLRKVTDRLSELEDRLDELVGGELEDEDEALASYLETLAVDTDRFAGGVA